MREFFKGWRRKAGLVTLAVACLLTVGWMRSLVLRERIVLYSSGMETYYLCSHEQAIRIVYNEWSPSLAQPGGVRNDDVVVIPYLAIIPSLTVISAWLIAGKQKKPSPTIPNPAD